MGYFQIILFSICSWVVGGVTGAFFDDMIFGQEGFDLFTLVIIGFAVYGMYLYFCYLYRRGLPSKKWGIWTFVILGALFLFDINDIADAFMAISFWVDAWLLYETLPQNRVQPVTPQPNPFETEPPATVVNTVKEKHDSWNDASLGELFRQAIACRSSQIDPNFQQLLIKTERLNNDLMVKDVHVPEVLNEHIRTMLITYLDLDDDPIQTRKTSEVRAKLKSGFETVYEALENLYDQKIMRNKMNLEADMAALEMKLRQDGLLDSDFELSE